jgi:hypothetical protein
LSDKARGAVILLVDEADVLAQVRRGRPDASRESGRGQRPQLPRSEEDPI